MREWIIKSIEEYVVNNPENSLKNSSNEPAWDKPLIGFASGADLLWEEIKKDVGSFVMTPYEIFSLTYPFLTDIRPQDLTVIAWILPQTLATKNENRKADIYPSERWARARKYGEEFNEKLRLHVVNLLTNTGYESVAPQLSPYFKLAISDKYGLSSSWSERHAAYIAGLGTFGLCDGLITPLGKAIRCGSVVSRIKLDVTKRPYTHHREYCPFFTEKTCGVCIERCPVGAISQSGHNKEKCRKHIDEVTKDYINKNYGFDAYGCGLCQVGVPCESTIP